MRSTPCPNFQSHLSATRRDLLRAGSLSLLGLGLPDLLAAQEHRSSAIFHQVINNISSRHIQQKVHITCWYLSGQLRNVMAERITIVDEVRSELVTIAVRLPERE